MSVCLCAHASSRFSHLWKFFFLHAFNVHTGRYVFLIIIIIIFFILLFIFFRATSLVWFIFEPSVCRVRSLCDGYKWNLQQKASVGIRTAAVYRRTSSDGGVCVCLRRAYYLHAGTRFVTNLERFKHSYKFDENISYSMRGDYDCCTAAV